MNVLISVGTGNYVDELNRCAPSIKKWWPWSVMAWRDELPPGSPTHANQQYAFKAFAAKWAFDNGYETLTWIDSKIHLANSPVRYMEHLNQEGYFFQDNGFNCAQTCTDKMLNHYGISRDSAENIIEVLGGVWGLHVRNRDFVDEFCANAQIGLFSGSHYRNPSDSTDPRFLFCRHDQSVLSLMLHKRGWHPSSNQGPAAFFYYGKHSEIKDHIFVLDQTYISTYD